MKTALTQPSDDDVRFDRAVIDDEGYAALVEAIEEEIDDDAAD